MLILYTLYFQVVCKYDYFYKFSFSFDFSLLFLQTSKSTISVFHLKNAIVGAYLIPPMGVFVRRATRIDIRTRRIACGRFTHRTGNA